MSGSKKGKFIVIEGIDGSGKSTLVSRLYYKFIKLGMPCEKTFEPTDGEIGQLIRTAFRGDAELSEQCIAALFAADRLYHIQNSHNGLISLINRGIHVVCDRYILSSCAYHVPYVSMEWVVNTNSICANLLMPDLTIYLDLPVKLSLQRLKATRNQLEIFETEGRLTQVSHNYEMAIEYFSHRNHKIHRIDASLQPDLVFENAWMQIEDLLNENR